MGIEEVGISECNRRIAAIDIKASIDSPPFSRALVEGYLVNVPDTSHAGENKPVTLTVTGMIEPGKAYTEGLPAMTCMELSTGGFVPEGDYALVKHMDIVKTGNGIIVKKPVNRGDNIESKGCEQKKGEVIVRLGTKLSPKEIMLYGKSWYFICHRDKKPVVAIFSTGNEILDIRNLLNQDMSGMRIHTHHCTRRGLRRDAACGGYNEGRYNHIPKGASWGLTRVDMAVISGGTAAGGGEFIVELINSIDVPGVVVNGVPMRSGKPLIMGYFRRSL